jgi:excisionase family DNA binding protein|tara:strand:- start:541 stop:717 length:177 start_codon:yes stop_codon:yes gene_type:complete
MSNMELLTISEAADMFKVSTTTIRRNLTSIPHIRIGNQIRIPVDKLNAWIDAQLRGDE